MLLLQSVWECDFLLVGNVKENKENGPTFPLSSNLRREQRDITRQHVILHIYPQMNVYVQYVQGCIINSPTNEISSLWFSNKFNHSPYIFFPFMFIPSKYEERNYYLSIFFIPSTFQSPTFYPPRHSVSAYFANFDAQCNIINGGKLWNCCALMSVV